MPLKFVALAVAVLLLAGGSASAQTCLHGSDETPREAERRALALSGVRVINSAQANRLNPVPLEQLADSPAVRAMRAEVGPLGDAARVMRFDREEILPGWRMHFVLGARGYALMLRDTRDFCGFTYSSNETGEIVQGYPIARGLPRLLPTSE